MNHVVLLGDSIFDNASYVPGKPPVIEQLRSLLAGEWKATLLAIDGHVTMSVINQTVRLPQDASHLVVSCGGNDALGHANMLADSARSVAEVLQRFANVRLEFQSDYRSMLAHVLSFGLPTAVCTVYDTVPGYDLAAMAALSMFNEIILREAFSVNVPVLDLRLIFSEPADYSALSPIEPSAVGGEKITQAVCRLLNSHDFSQKCSAVYT